MWWLIFAAPAALVAYELLDEDRRAVWAKRWARARTRRVTLSPRAGCYRPRQAVNPRTIRPPRGPTAVCPPPNSIGDATRWAELRAEVDRLDTSEMLDLLANAKQGLDRRNGGSGLRSGGKIGTGSRREAITEVDEECYTCELLNREAAGPHEHPFEDLLAAERVERDLRPHRVQALLDLVNRTRAAAQRVRQ